MANVVCLIVNPTATQYDNVNAANEDVPAYSLAGPYTLTDAEVATFTAAHKTALIQVLTDATLTVAEIDNIRLASKILRLSKNPGYAIA